MRYNEKLLIFYEFLFVKINSTNIDSNYVRAEQTDLLYANAKDLKVH